MTKINSFKISAFKLFLNFKLKIKNLPKDEGITLVEIAVVIVIIVLFSLIIISDFPTIQRQFALSRVTYKLAQDLRRAQDLGLSGVAISDSQSKQIAAKGYGVYVDVSSPPAEKYLIYADVNGDQKYDGTFSTSLCSSTTNPTIDCIIEIIDVSKENPSLYISGINNIGSYSYTSINFSPPDPTTKIDNISLVSSPIRIILSNGSATRTVWVNTSGLINVQ